jgi:Na+-transporting methylmalonyl-CoA/oxaloacetate decarboxylase gamma subunit
MLLGKVMIVVIALVVAMWLIGELLRQRRPR